MNTIGRMLEHSATTRPHTTVGPDRCRVASQATASGNSSRTTPGEHTSVTTAASRCRPARTVIASFSRRSGLSG
jgi:hypothetical protein